MKYRSTFRSSNFAYNLHTELQKKHDQTFSRTKHNAFPRSLGRGGGSFSFLPYLSSQPIGSTFARGETKESRKIVHTRGRVESENVYRRSMNRRMGVGIGGRGWR